MSLKTPRYGSIDQAAGIQAWMAGEMGKIIFVPATTFETNRQLVQHHSLTESQQLAWCMLHLATAIWYHC